MILLAASNEIASPTTWTATSPLAPLLVLGLCVVAGLGTMLLLPGRRDATWRVVGGILLAFAGGAVALSLMRWAASVAGVGAMGASYIYFWIFAAVALGGSVRVITHPRPVYSALYFVLTVFATAGLFLLVHADFMAAALILIYAGAILVTYVFVIMLASEATSEVGGSGATSGLPDHDARAREPFMASLVGFLVMGVLLFVIFEKASPVARNDLGGLPSQVVRPDSGTQQLGAFLFRYHFVNIQLAGLILTLAMIGAIMIARKKIVHAGASAEAIREAESPSEAGTGVVLGALPSMPDDPQSIPVVGTTNPRQKAYPEN